MYFIDVQGTLIDDKKRLPIRGSREFIDLLNAQKTPYMVVTNNTKYASGDFLQYLQSIGLNIPKEHYIDPWMLVASKVEKQSGVAAYGSPDFLDVLKSMGYAFDYTYPKTVLLSVRKDYTFEEFAQMIEFLLAGATLVGMHETTLYAKDEKRYPGVGAILQMLSCAASVPYETVGKPSVTFYNEALHWLQKQNNTAGFADVTMISDDLKGDLHGAAQLGMETVFVLSGKYKKAEEIIPFLSMNERPDAVFGDIAQMMEHL
jgi:NagD protein